MVLLLFLSLFNFCTWINSQGGKAQSWCRWNVCVVGNQCSGTSAWVLLKICDLTFPSPVQSTQLQDYCLISCGYVSFLYKKNARKIPGSFHCRAHSSVESPYKCRETFMRERKVGKKSEEDMSWGMKNMEYRRITERMARKERNRW